MLSGLKFVHPREDPPVELFFLFFPLLADMLSQPVDVINETPCSELLDQHWILQH